MVLICISNQPTSAGQECRKGNPSALLVGTQTDAATVENGMEFPQKIKNGAAFDSVIPLLGIYPKNPETPIQKNPVHPYVHSSTIYNSLVLEKA